MAPSRTYQNAASRWAGIGPYYAMFPVRFADETIQKYSQPGDTVIDPFAGRGTAVFSAATQDRIGIGIDINPVGFVYGQTKIEPARRDAVERRLEQLGRSASDYVEEADKLPEFFQLCFSVPVRQFLLAARSNLNWRKRKIDRTVMALLLVYLHGKKGAALSNQMRQTKAMSPEYSVRWWRARKFDPPEIDPVAFMRTRVRWRYAKGMPPGGGSRMYLGDSATKLRHLRTRIERGSMARARFLFTSPPYHAVTNYRYDQWLRLWLLGGVPNARRTGVPGEGKFEGRKPYRRLLRRVFEEAATILDESATVYVRTDTRKFTYDTTVAVLDDVFNDKVMIEIKRPLDGTSQTHLFGDTNGPKQGTGEVDLILKPR
ncbi:MAG: DNA methyltransferase [Gemmatimonadota bacterium]|nr:DNA methyltransferase [Gemmatimonadota bacterium]